MLLIAILNFPLAFVDLVAIATETASLTFPVLLIAYQWLSRLHLIGDTAFNLFEAIYGKVELI